MSIETFHLHQFEPDKGNNPRGRSYGDKREQTGAHGNNEQRSFGRERLTPHRIEELMYDLDQFLTLPDGTQRPITELLEEVNPDTNRAFAAPTGSGKTLAIVPTEAIAERAHIPPRRIIVVQPTRQLSANVSETLQALYGSDVIGHHFGGLGNERIQNRNAPILVVTPGQMWNMFRNGFIGPEDHVHFDELDACMNFAETEAAIAALNYQRTIGERRTGLTFSSATIPTAEQQDNFLSWAGAELHRSTDRLAFQPHLDFVDYDPKGNTGIGTVTKTAEGILDNPQFTGRNLLVLVAANSEVNTVHNNLTDHVASQWFRRSINEDVRVLQFRAVDDPVTFNQQVSTLVEEQMRREEEIELFEFEKEEEYQSELMQREHDWKEFAASLPEKLKDLPYDDQEKEAARLIREYKKSLPHFLVPMRLVIVGTYGSLASGINLPVHDAVGGPEYITPVRDEIRDRVVRRPVEGSIFLQAFGRIARFADGNFYLVRDKKANSFDWRTVKPDPLNKPITKQEMDRLFMDMLQAGVDPRNIPSWYSPVDTSSFEETYASLVSRGYIREGWLTKEARLIRENPIAEESLHWAIAAEGAPQEVKPEVQALLSLYDTEWRNLFPDHFFGPQSRAHRLVDILAEAGVITLDRPQPRHQYDTPDSKAFTAVRMADTGEEVPISDVALLYNLTKFLERVPQMRRQLRMGDRAFEAVKVKVKNCDAYMQKRQLAIEGNGYITSKKWDSVLDYLITEQVGHRVRLSTAYRASVVASSGVVHDFIAQRNEPGWGIVLSPHSAGRTTFTKNILGIIPQGPGYDYVQWLPETYEDTLKPFFDKLVKKESLAEVQNLPNVKALLERIDAIKTTVAHYKARDGKISDYNADPHLRRVLTSYLVRNKVASFQKLEDMLDELAGSGVPYLPEMETVLPSERREEIDKVSPDKAALIYKSGEEETIVDLLIRYSGGTGYVTLPFTSSVPVRDGEFKWEEHPLWQIRQTDIDTLIASLPPRPNGYGYTLEIDADYRRTGRTLDEIRNQVTLELGPRRVITQLNTRAAEEPVRGTVQSNINDLIPQIGIFILGYRPDGSPIYGKQTLQVATKEVPDVDRDTDNQ